MSADRVSENKINGVHWNRSVFSKIYCEPTRNGFLSPTTNDSSETPSNSQINNGFAIPHSMNDIDSITLESQEGQAGSTTNTQLDDDMEQDTNDNEEIEEDNDEEEEDKPSSSSSPTTNVTDENSSSSNSNSTPLPSSSTEDMIDQ